MLGVQRPGAPAAHGQLSRGPGPATRVPLWSLDEERGAGPGEPPCAAGVCLRTLETLCCATFISGLLLHFLLNRVLLWPRACCLQIHLSLPCQLISGWVQPRGGTGPSLKGVRKGETVLFLLHSAFGGVSGTGHISSLVPDPTSHRETPGLGFL